MVIRQLLVIFLSLNIDKTLSASIGSSSYVEEIIGFEPRHRRIGNLGVPSSQETYSNDCKYKTALVDLKGLSVIVNSKLHFF